VQAKRRYPCGKLIRKKEHIGPTPETVARKAALTGSIETIHFADCLINILYARNVITEHHKDAAFWYENLWRSIFGSPHPRPMVIERVVNSNLTPDEHVGDRINAHQFKSATKHMTPQERQTLINLVIFDIGPIKANSQTITPLLDKLVTAKKTVDKYSNM
jgi:hypothetical protein